MKGKLKTIILIVLITIISIIPITNVNAHNVELDQDGIITLPLWIIGGSGTIIVSDKEQNYQLYWQDVEISNENYEKVNKIRTEGEEQTKKLEEEIQTLKKEVTDLLNKSNEATEKYLQKENENADKEEIEKAIEEKNIADKNYNDKLEECNKKIDEYNKEAEEINQKCNDLIPIYNDNNWKKAEKGKIAMDTSKFSGKKSYIIWAKLITTDGKNIYNNGMYTISGSKQEENTDTDTKQEETPKTEPTSKATNNDDTTAKGTLPKTGINFGLLLILIASLGITIFLYKKTEKYKGVK